MMRERGLMRTAARDLVDLPELNIAFFSFLLHFVWEIWQVPFFAGMPSTSHWSGVAVCSRATLGDAAMAVVAFWGGALPRRSRYWFVGPRGWEVLIYLAIGLTLTVVFESLATGPLARWSYGPEMPRLPIFGTGLSPALQWVLIPPVALWITARQLRNRMPSP
jgi:hypothetical protein